jgi:hypothetical protein
MTQQGISAIGKFRKIVSTHTLYALGLIMLAVALRLVLSGLGWPTTNSDEATMGLMGMHIAYQGEHPTFFYGQYYMGSLEAYLAVVPFRLFGASVFTLRLGLIFMFALFLLSMYLLTRLLFTKEFALLCLALLSLGSFQMFLRQLQANGGYIETLMLAAACVLLAGWLALTFGRNRLHRRRRLLRLSAYSCLGLAMGLSLWSDPITLPFLLAAAAILVIFCWREAFTWAPICLLLGVIIGAYPLISYNIAAPSGHDTWTVLQRVQEVGSNTPKAQTLAIYGAILISIPTATGATPLCSPPDPNIIINKTLNPHYFPCALIQGVWGIGYLVLLLVAFLLSIWGVWKLWRTNAGLKKSSLALAASLQESQEERQQRVRLVANLALLGGASLAIFLYARTPAPAFAPLTNARYLTDLLVVTPALLWPLWHARVSGTPIWTTFAWVWIGCRRAILLLIGVVFVIGTISTFELVPSTQAADQQQETFVHNLLQVKATRIYSDYWTCDRVAFQSQERIICSVLDPGLHADANRYGPYRTIVDADPQAAYVFGLHSAEAAAVARMVAHSQKHYRRMVFDGYVLYQPEAG